mgnify:CR=1 FL=1
MQLETKTTRDEAASELGAAEILLIEYQTITQQIVHWDTFFWTKARFFLAVEGVALLATVDRLIPYLPLQRALEINSFYLLLAMVVLNLSLCYVWLLTGRRNREFLGFRFERGIAIEQHPALRGLVRMFQYQDEKLKEPDLRGKFSHYWEINMPWLFSVAWLGVLASGAALLHVDNALRGASAVALAAVICAVTVRFHDRAAMKRLPGEVSVRA